MAAKSRLVEVAVSRIRVAVIEYDDFGRLAKGIRYAMVNYSGLQFGVLEDLFFDSRVSDLYTSVACPRPSRIP